MKVPRHGRRPRTMRAAALLAFVSLAVAACGSDGEAGASPDDAGETEPASESEPTTDAPLDEVVLGPARLESITNAATVVGVADGIFEECNIDASLQAAGGGGNQVQALQSGAIDVIFPSVSAVIPAFLAGADIRIVAGESQGTNGMAWLTLPDSDLSEVADLQGRSVSVSAIGSNTATTFQAILEVNDVPVDSVEQVVIAEVGAGLAALASQAVDAVWATEPSVTLFESSGEAEVLFRADEFIDENQLTVTAVRGEYLEENPELVERTLDCMQLARDAAAEDVTRVGTEFAESAQLDTDVAISVLERSIANDESTMNLTVPGLQSVLDSLIASETVPADTTLESLSGLFAVPEGAAIEIEGGEL